MLKARQKLGKFRIERRLNDGPLAGVYQAFDTIHGQRVALKVPHPQAMEDHFLVDFKREARLASRLEHPNILPIRDASFIDGYFVISMPMGEESLAERMRRRMSLATAFDLADQALAAVAHAHEQNVIHCDIKPDNFILFAGGRLRLTDFGFSKIAQRSMKASGSGTLGYLAPEQAMGRPMFQSDVFALGLVIYRLFSGELPEWPYTWPPVGSEKLKRKLKPDLVAWLKKAIEFKPQDRYRNAVSMRRTFRQLANGSLKPAARRKRASKKKNWKAIQFGQFKRRYGKVLQAHHECHDCGGPVSESMQACPWCGSEDHLRAVETKEPAACPRCERGVKLDWNYCAWCYGAGFEEETNRRYTDRRYVAKCENSSCRGPLFRFMRYCPWCRTKVRRRWSLPGSRQTCDSCGWGIAKDFWTFCPWCKTEIEQ